MASASKIRTRHSSQTKVAEYLEPGKPLNPSQLPTLRAILRQGLLYQEEREIQEDTVKSSITLGELARDMTAALMENWKRANAEFKVPVVISEKAIQDKLKLAWETVQKIVWKKITKLTQISTFEAKLDKLVDITKCKCQIQPCQIFGCPEKYRKCSSCGRCGDCRKCKECVECNQVISHYI